MHPSSTRAAGSGKTHTLIGDVGSDADKGLVARAVNELAQGIAGDQEGCEFQVPISALACAASTHAHGLPWCCPPAAAINPVGYWVDWVDGSSSDLSASTHVMHARLTDDHHLGDMRVMASVALQVQLSVVEIYCERIRDLLTEGACSGDSLTVQQDRERGILIAGATEARKLSHTPPEILLVAVPPLTNPMRRPFPHHAHACMQSEACCARPKERHHSLRRHGKVGRQKQDACMQVRAGAGAERERAGGAHAGRVCKAHRGGHRHERGLQPLALPGAAAAGAPCARWELHAREAVPRGPGRSAKLRPCTSSLMGSSAVLMRAAHVYATVNGLMNMKPDVHMHACHVLNMHASQHPEGAGF